LTHQRALHAPAWLTARPIAHRGLHDAAKGLVENSMAAAKAAAARNYAIECDIQRTSDGEAVVFHDKKLDRLTKASGLVEDFTAHEIAAIPLKASDQSIPTLGAFLAGLGGEVPVIIEIKSRFDGDLRLADRALSIVAGAPGPLCLKSFDPVILAHLRAKGADCPLGLVAQAQNGAGDWPGLSVHRRDALTDLRDFPLARPDFLSWHVGDLPHAVPMLCRAGIGMPVMTWTVRSPADHARAGAWADQVIFEGFEPA
jgi:glycerophosphoryl diester phosphodiesterase